MLGHTTQKEKRKSTYIPYERIKLLTIDCSVAVLPNGSCRQ